MDLNELCQFLESVIESPKLDDKPEVVAKKLGKTLLDIEDIPIPIEIPGRIGIAFVIEDIDTPLVKILQKAKSVIMLDTVPVLLSVCDGCECPDCDICVEVADDVPEVTLEVTPEVNEEVNELREDFVERFTEKVEEYNDEIVPEPLLLANPSVELEDDEGPVAELLDLDGAPGRDQ